MMNKDKISTSLHQTTPLAKKTTAVVFVIFLAMFAHFKPYENSAHLAQSSAEQLFVLFHFITNQTLGIVHEGGHGVCYLLPCPEFLTALNGTIFQWLFPFLVGYYYKRRGQPLGYLIGLFFLGFSMQYTAWYISTAHEGLHLSAAKSFLGVDANHDFNYILSSLGLLKYNATIAMMTKTLAYLVMIYSVLAMFVLAFFSSSSTRRSGSLQRRFTSKNRSKYSK
jgi:hypothetical protein